MTVILNILEGLASLWSLWLKLLIAVVLSYILVTILASGWIANNLRTKSCKISVVYPQKKENKEKS